MWQTPVSSVGLLGNHDRERDVAGLELGPVLVRALVPPEAERLAVELQRAFLVLRGDRDEVRPLDANATQAFVLITHRRVTSDVGETATRAKPAWPPCGVAESTPV